MSPLSSSQPIVRFGHFVLDLRSGELRRNGIPVKLQVQPFQVLQALLEQAGQIVTREDLQKRIWPADTFVDFDQGLNTAVKKLREALGDDAEKPHFIQTLSKRGYRFIGSIHNGLPATKGTTDLELPAKDLAKTYPKVWGLSLGAVVTVLILVLGFNTAGIRDRVLRKSSAQRIESLAVLPLQNLSGDPNQEYFSDGITDALITDLAQISSFKVISRTSIMRYKKTDKSLPEIASELNVDEIVEGAVQRSGDRVRVTAQLIHGPSDKHLWANTYDGEIHDTFALESNIAEDIAHHVQERLTLGKATQIAQPKRVETRVLVALLQGNYHLQSFGNGGGDEEKRKAAEYFQQAIDADPSFAPAYLGLARAHMWLLWPSNQDAEIATKAVQRALALDPGLSDAHETLAQLNLLWWKWSAAEDEFRRAIAINPNNADAHSGLGELLLILGKLDEGYREDQIAQALDPNYDHLSDALERQGQFDRTIDMELMFLKRYPLDGQLHVELFKLYLKKGMYEEASLQIEPTSIAFGLQEIAEAARRARAVSGGLGAIRASLKGLEHAITTHQIFIPVNLAEYYAALGDKDRAFYWLERAYAQQEAGIASDDLNLARLNMDYLLDPLRSDPRFKDLVRRVGLPQ